MHVEPWIKIDILVSLLPYWNLIRLTAPWVKTARSDLYYVNNVIALFAHLTVSVLGQLLKYGQSIALWADSLETHRTIVTHYRHPLHITCTRDLRRRCLSLLVLKVL